MDSFSDSFSTKVYNMTGPVILQEPLDDALSIEDTRDILRSIPPAAYEFQGFLLGRFLEPITWRGVVSLVEEKLGAAPIFGETITGIAAVAAGSTSGVYRSLCQHIVRNKKDSHVVKEEPGVV